MKRDLQKIKEIKLCVQSFYLKVSDKKIAIKYGVSERSVAELRRRMGLKKPLDIVGELQKGARRIKRNNKRVEY